MPVNRNALLPASLAYFHGRVMPTMVESGPGCVKDPRSSDFGQAAATARMAVPELIRAARMRRSQGDCESRTTNLGGRSSNLFAFREGALPFPDGAIIAALHCNEASSDADNQVLATGFPGLGLEWVFAGSAVNVQFMVKDSKKYTATDGWGVRRLHQRQTWRRGAA